MKEKDLLAGFLVGNELHDVVTLQQFSQYFPSQYRTHPEVKDLYRAYLSARHQARTKVRRNIEVEVRRNPFHLDPQASGSCVVDVDDSLDEDVLGTDDMEIEGVDKHLTLDQAIQELVRAEKIYKQEIKQLEEECNEFAQEFQDMDREMEAVQLPEQSASNTGEEALLKNLQHLIAICDSIAVKPPQDSPES
ncbi:hypothetical protein EDD11_008376 [Mortierella claussenii]|nr:hypothetical protein EDD11_008376 [Mortierella claussenii]